VLSGKREKLHMRKWYKAYHILYQCIHGFSQLISSESEVCDLLLYCILQYDLVFRQLTGRINSQCHLSGKPGNVREYLTRSQGSVFDKS